MMRRVIQLVRPRYGNDFHAERLFEEIYETCAFDRPAVPAILPLVHIYRQVLRRIGPGLVAVCRQRHQVAVDAVEIGIEVHLFLF